jgi:hypothetical protein
MPPRRVLARGAAISTSPKIGRCWVPPSSRNRGSRPTSPRAGLQLTPTVTHFRVSLQGFTPGVFFGSDLVNGLQPFAPINVFQHWDEVPSQAIAPIGNFTDFEGNSVTLFNQVEAADDPGGGPRFPYISTSWAPGASQCDINNPDLCPDTDDGETDGTTDGDGSTGVPYPGTLILIGTALVALGVARRR